MNLRASERSAALSGIVSAVLLFVGIITSTLPGGTDSDQKMANIVNDHGDRVRMIIAAYMLTLAAVLFLWFLSGLRTRLLAAEGMPGPLTAAGFAAGVVFAGLIVATAAAEAGMVMPITGGKEHTVGVTIAYVGWFGVMAFIFSMIAAALLAASVSIIALRTRVFAPWLGWLGYVTAVALLLGFFFFPLVLLPIWLIAIGIAMLRQGPAATTAPA